MQSIHLFQNFLLYFIAFMIGDFLYFSISALSIFIVGEIIGYKFASFDLGGFQFIRENKELKFRSTKFTLFPSLLMFPPERHSQEKKVLYECAPLFLGLLVVVMGSVGMMWMPKGILRTILAVILFALLLNFIVHFWNELKLLFNMYGKGPESIFWRENERVSDLLKVGVQPKEIEFFIPEAGESFGKATSVRSVSHWNYDFMRYYKALQIAQEGLNVAGHFPMKGLAYMEKDLILQLMQRIQTLS